MTTTLTWRPRLSKAKRPAALAIVQEIYPGATDDGAAIQITHPDGDARVCFIYMCGLFRGIEAGS